jgi:hypothetical protein
VAARSRRIEVYGDQLYERDLAKCRRVFMRRVIEGAFDDTAELAVRLGLNRRTVQGFFSGDAWMAKETATRLLRELGLTFDDVHRRVRVVPEDLFEWPWG